MFYFIKKVKMEGIKMLKLSIDEQKQINGGGVWVIKVYDGDEYYTTARTSSGSEAYKIKNAYRDLGYVVKISGYD